MAVAIVGRSPSFSSFPRKRESIATHRNAESLDPAYAGMTSKIKAASSRRAAEPRTGEIDPRRLARNVQQHLRIRLVEAHRRDLVPAEERRLTQPFRVGRDFL